MSSGGTSTVSPQEPQAFKRAVRKIKCAAMVANLAKSWQGWATEHSDIQDAIPSGWMPDSVEGVDEKARSREVKLTNPPRVFTADASDSSGIRTGSVAKSVQPKRSECSSSSVVNAIRGKMEAGPEESKPFLGNESPTRRRQMRALQTAADGSIRDKTRLLQDKKLGSRSSSLDTEDSGLGEEAGLSDNNESKTELGDILSKKQTNRPKVECLITKIGKWMQTHYQSYQISSYQNNSTLKCKTTPSIVFYISHGSSKEKGSLTVMNRSYKPIF